MANEKCNHDLAEQEAACYTDGLCPICLRENLSCLQAETAALREQVEKRGEAIKWLLETVKWVRDNETCNAYNDEYLKKRCSGILGSDFDKIMGEQDE